MRHTRDMLDSLTAAPGELRGLFRLRNNVTIEHKRGEEVLEHRELHNLITNAGKAAIAGLINGAATPAGGTFDVIGLGTGTTAAAAADTALETEITTNGGQRQAGSTSRVTVDVTNDGARVSATFTFSGSFAVTEAGLFDQTTVSGSTMAARQVFSALNVVSGDSLTITWTIDVD